MSQLKVLYDHQTFSTQKFGGVSKYFVELIKHLPVETKFDLPLLLSENQYLKEEIAFFGKKNVSLPARHFLGKGYLKRMLFRINEAYSVRAISRKDYDVFHPTFYNNYFLKNLRTPFVLTVHDLIEYKFAKQFFSNNSMKTQMENAISKANRIIAISENTKTDLSEYLNINPDKIDVIHHGFQKPPGNVSDNAHGNYILYVGKRETYKNFTTFTKAISPILQREKELQLICVGRGFSAAEKQLLADLKILRKSTAMGVDEKKLNELYHHARVFVFPSLYEGFGMPILEAMANDCPVCLSNTSCFPEIAGNAGEYFDPSREEAILHAVEKVLYDVDYKDHLIKNGRKRLENFSWNKTALQTVDTYRKSI